jgi:hypothetical protein
MKLLTLTLFLICAFSLLVSAQKKYKPWMEWNEKETQKMLDDSPWGQTQNDTNTSEMTFNPANRGSGQGANNQAANLSYGIRFLSAKPIRQAIARSVILKNPQMTEQLKAFAEQQSDKYIVVAVDYKSSDRRLTGQAMQLFNSANIGLLKNGTYLERKDGKRIFLDQYMAPINDGMGAKFVFPRMLDEKPFVDKDSGYLRFYSEFPGATPIKLNMRFKIADMIYEEKLEY